jgi:DNA-binding HxlR family transcriptional regulator
MFVGVEEATSPCPCVYVLDYLGMGWDVMILRLRRRRWRPRGSQV